jgi:hypothetical protein
MGLCVENMAGWPGSRSAVKRVFATMLDRLSVSPSGGKNGSCVAEGGVLRRVTHLRRSLSKYPCRSHRGKGRNDVASIIRTREGRGELQRAGKIVMNSRHCVGYRRIHSAYAASAWCPAATGGSRKVYCQGYFEGGARGRTHKLI